MLEAIQVIKHAITSIRLRMAVPILKAVSQIIHSCILVKRRQRSIIDRMQFRVRYQAATATTTCHQPSSANTPSTMVVVVVVVAT